MLALMALVALAGSFMTVGAYAQPHLISVDVDPTSGVLDLMFDSVLDPYSVYTTRMHLQAGEYSTPLDPSWFVSVNTDRILFKLDSDTVQALRDEGSAHLDLGEGAVTSAGTPNSPHTSEVRMLLRVGVVVPPGNDDILAMARLAVEQLNVDVIGNDPPRAASIVVYEDEDMLDSYLALNQEGVDIVVGPGEILNVKKTAGGGTLVVACCTPYSDKSLLADPNSFALVPGGSDSFRAILTFMAERGVNLVIPVYVDDVSGRAMLPQIRAEAQSAVDAGVAYGPGESPDRVALRLSAIVAEKLLENPGANLGILLTDAADAPAILDAAHSDTALNIPQWFGAHAHLITDGPGAVFADEIDYSVPMYGTPSSALYAVLGTHVQEMTGTWPSSEAYSAYDAVYLAGQTLLESDARFEANLDSTILQNTMRELASDLGVSGYMGVTIQGELESPFHDIMEVRGNEWVKVAIHNPPDLEPAGFLNVGGVPVESYLYGPGQGIVTRVDSFGLLVYGYDDVPVESAIWLGLATDSMLPTVDVVVQDSGSVLDMMERFDGMDIDVVVTYANDDATAQAAEYARANNMVVVGTVSSSDVLAKRGDNLYRMTSPDSRLAEAVAHTLEVDGVLGAVALYEKDNAALLDAVVAGFVGEIKPIEYDAKDARHASLARQVAVAVGDMADVHGAAGIILIDEGAASIMATDTFYILPENTRWYGVGGHASQFALGDSERLAKDSLFSIISPSVSNDGPAQLALAPLVSLYDHPVPPTLLGIMDAARMVSRVLSDSAQTASDVDAALIKEVLPSVAVRSGLFLDDTSLDTNGDLASASYDLWVRYTNVWINDAVYEPSVGYITKTHVGVAVPITGALSKYGVMQMHAAHHAISAHNEQLATDMQSWQIAPIVVDTAGDPTRASGILSSFNDSRIKVALGPATGSVLEEMRTIISEYNMTLLSCCSDWPSTHPDNIFRLTPGYDGQAAALVAVAKFDGILDLVILHPDDTGGMAIAESIADEFGKDRTVLLEYDAGSPPHATLFDDAADSVAVTILPSRTGVVVAGFEHTDVMLEAADAHPVLRNAKWYGISRDGILPDLSHNPAAAAAARILGFTVASQAAVMVSPSLDVYMKWATGLEPNVGAYAMYDSAQLLTTTLSYLDGIADATMFADLLPLVASEYQGLVGDVDFDENDYIKNSIYHIWAIPFDAWQATHAYDVFGGLSELNN